MDSNKLEYISQIRVFSLFLIVFYHCICFYLGKWGLPCADFVSPFWSMLAPSLVNIGLTNFVLISGFLYGYLYRKGKYHRVLPFLKGKALRLLLPYLLWSSFMIYMIPDSGYGLKGMIYGIAHLWFLLMLFELFFIISIANLKGSLLSSSRKVDFLVFVLSFFPLLITKYIFNAHFPLAFELTMKYIPIFLLGIFAAKHSIIGKIRSSMIVSMALLGGGVLCVLTSNSVDSNNEIYTYASGCVCLSLMATVERHSTPTRFSSWLDPSCMGIYLLNQIVIYYILLNYNFRLFANQHEYLGPLVMFIISFGLPLFITKFVAPFKWSRYIIG